MLEVSSVVHVSTRTDQRTYSIKEAAALTGLPASTLRYYESIGVTAPVGRGASSKHRVYDENDLDHVMWIACLAATGMSVSDMKQYVANSQSGGAAAREQIELLTAQQRRLELEARHLALRQRYVALKIEFWSATDAGDEARAEVLSEQARTLADDLRRAGRH